MLKPFKRNVSRLKTIERFVRGGNAAFVELLWPLVLVGCCVQNRTVFLVLSLKLLSPAYHSYPKLSPLAQNQWTHRKFLKVLTITQHPPPYRHNLITVQCLVVLALHPSLLLLGHLHHPLLKLLIAPFGMLHRVSGINSLYLFVYLILIPIPPFPTHLFLHTSLLPLLFHHSAHPQLPLSFTPGLKPTRLGCFTNPTPVVSLLLPGLPSQSFARTFSPELIVFLFLVFP